MNIARAALPSAVENTGGLSSACANWEQRGRFWYVKYSHQF